MLSPFLVISPAHRCDARLAIAAARAGETGILDLGYGEDWQARQSAFRSLARHARAGSAWGIRWDALGDSPGLPARLRDLPGQQQCPVLVLAGLEGGEALRQALAQARPIAARVILEVYSLAGALAAQEAGFDGLVVKGHEAGGRVGEESAFLLLQRLHGRLAIPYWVQGGIGPDTAAAAFLAGASGVVLGEQLWLAAESPLEPAERRRWDGLDGSETVCAGEGDLRFRFFCRSGPRAMGEYQKALAAGDLWPVWLRRQLVSAAGPTPEPWVALGQEIAFARSLADRHVNVAGILEAFRRQVQTNLATAHKAQALAPESPLARAHDTRYPILQGPMTRVSDTSAFCRSVSETGALPFLALALMTGPEVNRLLTETKVRMGGRPWGVGVLGFAPEELRRAQLEEILQARPSHAIIAGGRPSQARKLEQHGIATYLHVPSPGLLQAFIQDGARKFIFEGRECGGHVGPRSSFTLWQSAIDVLLRAEAERPEEFQIVFAGGIHDRLSAAMVAAAAAPLTARGMKIGVLMGTAYLFTREAVTAGAIGPEFQRQALACEETVLLESGAGHATRCVNTPFAEEFRRARAELVRAGKGPEEVRLELELLNIGRLRIASKGLARASDPRRPGAKAELVAVPEEEQRRQGMYMIGQVAGLRKAVVSMADLHADVSRDSGKILDAQATRSLPWQRPAGPKTKTAEIAIVGMAGLFPKAADLRRYWQNICNRVDAVGGVPPGRWRLEDFYAEDRRARDRTYSRWGGFLEEIFFDPVKWRIPPASLPHIEPIQLLALEVASRAMADAGYDRRAFPRERAGVVFAVAGSHDRATDYGFRAMMRHYLPRVEGLPPETRAQIYASLEAQLPEWTEDSFPGFLENVVAGRIARELDLHGANFTVDAACASSLAALHVAVEKLRSGTADLMLVGGADGTNNPFGYVSFAKTHALSPRGRSRAFDDSGDGIALGEGIGCVVLKRLADAERDGDKVYAVIKGVGASSDGKNRSLTAPHPAGQGRALARAYDDAQVSPASVTLIEAHGTGTAVGDSAELTSLTEIFAPNARERQYVAVGSVKSMIGHTKTVAGLASLIKAALALKQRVLPPTLGVEKPNTRVDWAGGPVYLNTELRPWVEGHGEHPRRAGVSAFGFGGTNFHVVLEEYVGDYHPAGELNWAPRPAEVVVLRRAGRDEVLAALGRLEWQLTSAVTEDLAGLACAVFTEESARTGPGAGCRLAIVAASVEDLRQKVRKARALLAEKAEVDDPSGVYYSEAAPAGASEVCFLYPGQGSQSANMLRDLVIACPWGQDLFLEANRLLADDLPRPLSRYVYPPPVFSEEDRRRQSADLQDTRVAQPALGLLELFATDLLGRFGIRPGRLAGHSYGELVALQVAGGLSREDLFRLSAARGRVCAEAAASCPGGLAAVQAGAAVTEAALKELNIPAGLANLNSPDQTVIAGPAAAIAAAVEQQPRRGLRVRSLPVSAPFHVPLLSTASAALEPHLARLTFGRPALPVYSNTTGAPHPEEPEALRRLLARHISEPVLFEQEVRRLHADGARIFVEVGPGKVLTGLVSRILAGEPVTALSLDAPGRNGWTQLGHVLARLAVLGLPVQLAAWFQGRGLAPVAVAEFLEQARAERTPKPTDWVLSPGKAEPVTPLPARAPGGAGKVASNGAPPARQPAPAPTRTTTGVNGAAARSAAGLTRPPTVAGPGNHAPTTNRPGSTRQRRGETMTTTNGNHSSNGTTTGANSGNDLLAQFHATTRVLLETQQAQSRVLERFLETQDRVLLYATQGVPLAPAVIGPPLPAQPAAAPPAPAALPAPRLRPAPAAVKPPVAIPASRPAAPSRLTVEPAVARNPGSSGPVAATHGVARAALEESSAAGPAPAPDAEGPPSTEQFRKDLLDVVSTRTGYPTDALDETLHLEAALGIDSIKTVEIFSNLKAYHPYFRTEGADEEDQLTEFTKLKTLRDIINSYDRRRLAHLAGSQTNGTAKPATGNPDGAVERHEVVAVPAPAVNGAKKNSLTATSSS
jgi:acyl transferase domain-containing protein/NAD(P)H-dependent flavin oxidoreductase YrpB (nitropropane dioxygenase family)